jgi:hypothetical protein
MGIFGDIPLGVELSGPVRASQKIVPTCQDNSDVLVSLLFWPWFSAKFKVLDTDLHLQADKSNIFSLIVQQNS